MNKMDWIAKEEKEEKEKLQLGNLATYVKFDYFNFDESKEHEAYMLVTMIAPEMKMLVERKPLNISACIDVSGSMSGNKLDYVKKSMKKMVQHLTDKDTLGIVTFSTSVEENLKSVKMTTDNKEKAFKIIKGMDVRDMTNLSGGLFKSIEQVKNAHNKDSINRVMLFTDGQANEGVTTTEALSPLMVEQLGSISASFFGFGNDYNEEMLTKLSKDGKGNLHHLMTSEDIPTAFAKELGSLLTVFAQNIEVELKCNKGVKLLENFNSDFKVVADQSDKKCMTLRINDIYSQESRNLLFKVKIEKGVDENKVVDIKVSYLDLIQNKRAESEKTAVIRLVEKSKADEAKDIDKDVAMQISISEAAKAQEVANIFAKQGNFAAASNAINAAAGTVRTYGAFVDNGTIQQDLSAAVGYYGDSASYTSNVTLSNAARMSYSTGRSSGGNSKLAQNMKKNIVTESLVKDFTNDEEEKA